MKFHSNGDGHSVEQAMKYKNFKKYKEVAMVTVARPVADYNSHHFSHPGSDKLTSLITLIGICSVKFTGIVLTAKTISSAILHDNYVMNNIARVNSQHRRSSTLVLSQLSSGGETHRTFLGAGRVCPRLLVWPTLTELGCDGEPREIAEACR